MNGANAFKVLSDRQRRDILVMLRGGRMSAGDIAQRLGASPAAVSYHLKLLREGGLVKEYRQGNFMYFELDTSVFDELIMWLMQFRGEENEKADMDNGSPLPDDNGGLGTADA
ncbi:MAG: winged helix-turn-helix transcriptional regulator [Ruminococcus sp.]|nr:winged helix-turn-helix transcriptional regulator [Ruminococcus sp.]